MLNLNSMMIGTSDIKSLAAYYEKVFGKKADMIEDDYHGWLVGKCFFTVGSHSEIKGQAKEPQRIIFNMETTEVKEEFDRISKIEGTKTIAAPYEMGGAWIATLSDPDGNYFQLMTPWKEGKN